MCALQLVPPWSFEWMNDWYVLEQWLLNCCSLCCATHWHPIVLFCFENIDCHDKCQKIRKQRQFHIHAEHTFPFKTHIKNSPTTIYIIKKMASPFVLQSLVISLCWWIRVLRIWNGVDLCHQYNKRLFDTHTSVVDAITGGLCLHLIDYNSNTSFRKHIWKYLHIFHSHSILVPIFIGFCHCLLWGVKVWL